MNYIFVMRYNKYSYSTFNYTLQYIKHTQKKWNEIMKNPCVSIALMLTKNCKHILKKYLLKQYS